MTNINVDLAVEYVKNIVDKNKCDTCDHLLGPYVRYPCGHFICQKCVATAEECLLCLSPPAVSTYFIDEPLTRRVEHISNLLTIFQELFNIDVFRRLRISEQLKLERQVFPECIQAPSKYCNKRKSFNISVKDKENITSLYIPGENTSYFKPFEMEDSNFYVQHWLDTNLKKPNKPRKPFADLKVNCNYSNSKSVDLVKNNVNEVVSKKRTHNKKLSYESKKLKQSPKAIKKQVFLGDNESIMLKNKKLDNNDSGIVFDDHTIVIDESQNDLIDKDKLACLAVIEAEKNNVNISTDYETTQSSSIRNNDININTKTIKAKSMLPFFKVPFYRKSSLYDVCSLCSQNANERKYRNNADNMSVTIENNNFIATINILHNKENSINLRSKHSVEVQTIDVNDKNENNVDQVNIHHGGEKNNANKANILLHQHLIQSENKQDTLLLNNKPKEQAITLNSVKVKGVIVAESETGSESENTDNENANLIETIADVHASEQLFSDFGILSSLEPNQYENRQKRKAVRGYSPISTDSSDKENYDPNRAKRQKFDKKSKKYNC